jgi:hypothetical protein
MKQESTHDAAWHRLSKLAAQAAPESSELPYALSTRVVAAWREGKKDNAWDVLEWLTMRGLVVAGLLLLGSAAFSYDAVTTLFTTGVVEAGEVLNHTFEL